MPPHLPLAARQANDRLLNHEREDSAGSQSLASLDTLDNLRAVKP